MNSGGANSTLLKEDIFGSTKKSTFTYILLQKPGGLIMVSQNSASPPPPVELWCGAVGGLPLDNLAARAGAPVQLRVGATLNRKLLS